MSGWMGLAVSALLLVVWLWLPGYVVLTFFGFRRVAGIALAPVVSTAIISAVGIILQLRDIPWQLTTVVVATAVLTIVISACGLLLRRIMIQPRWLTNRIPFGRRAIFGTLFSGALLLIMVGWGIHSPSAFSQTFDNIFHLNAIRYILDTQQASPFTISQVTGAASQDLYPAAWHTLASLAVLSSGVPIPVAVNALTLVTVGVIWPLGVAFLAWSIWRVSKPGAVVTTALISFASSSFPLLFVHFGVLYPNLLGFAFLPGACAVLTRAVISRTALSAETRLSAILVSIAVLGGMAAAHPSASLVALVILVVAVCVRVWARIGDPRFGFTGLPLLGAIIVTLGLGAIVGVLWGAVRPDQEAAVWKPTQSLGQAAGRVVTNETVGLGMSLLLTILVSVGVVAMVKRGHWIWSLTLVLLAWAYCVVTGGESGELRDFVGGVFYNDGYRLAALLGLPTVLLAGYGLSAITDMKLLRGRPVAIVTLTLVVVVGLLLPLKSSVHAIRLTFDMTPTAPLVDSDELALIDSLGNILKPQDRVLVNPGTGAALAYALDDQKVVGAHVFFHDSSDENYVRTHLRQGATAPLCNALKESGITYVLDFGMKQVNDEQRHYPGMERLGPSVATLVASQGHARLLKIVACDDYDTSKN